MRNTDALSVPETAKLLDCTTKYVFDLLHAGRLHGARKGGRVWRVPSAAVHAYLTSHLWSDLIAALKQRAEESNTEQRTQKFGIHTPTTENIEICQKNPVMTMHVHLFPDERRVNYTVYPWHPPLTGTFTIDADLTSPPRAFFRDVYSRTYSPGDVAKLLLDALLRYTS
jgi:excisionase family DNA binding protein